MAELAGARVEVGIEPAEPLIRSSVPDLEEPDLGVPRQRLGRFDEAQAEDLLAERQHAAEDGIERQVGRDLVGVHPVLLRPDLAVVVGHVPGTQAGVPGVGLEPHGTSPRSRSWPGPGAV